MGVWDDPWAWDGRMEWAGGMGLGRVSVGGPSPLALGGSAGASASKGRLPSTLRQRMHSALSHCTSMHSALSHYTAIHRDPLRDPTPPLRTVAAMHATTLL